MHLSVSYVSSIIAVYVYFITFMISSLISTKSQGTKMILILVHIIHAKSKNLILPTRCKCIYPQKISIRISYDRLSYILSFLWHAISHQHPFKEVIVFVLGNIHKSLCVLVRSNIKKGHILQKIKWPFLLPVLYKQLYRLHASCLLHLFCV